MPCIARRGAQTPQVLASVLRTAQQRGLDTTAVLVTALWAAGDRPPRLPARPLTRTTRVSRPCTDWITVLHRPVLRLHLSHRPAKQRPTDYRLANRYTPIDAVRSGVRVAGSQRELRGREDTLPRTADVHPLCASGDDRGPPHHRRR